MLDPYVGLYFALEMATFGNDCAVWAIDLDWLVTIPNADYPGEERASLS